MSEDTTTAGNDIVIERVFKAPRDLVWRMWTEPEHFMRWYGPTGASAAGCEIDFRVGGRHLFGLQTPDGRTYWTTGTYLEIVPLERFVTSELMSDEHGNAVATMPETTVTVTLEDLGDGRTRMTLRHGGWPEPGMAEGAGGGWSQAFDKLEAVLAAG